MKIEIKKSPRYKDAPDESCMHFLSVNGIEIGAWYGGKDKKYLNPEKWAKEMIAKRNVVIERNIARLENDLNRWKAERGINY